jgi:hypothetical protein
MSDHLVQTPTPLSMKLNAMYAQEQVLDFSMKLFKCSLLLCRHCLDEVYCYKEQLPIDGPTSDFSVH